MGRRNKWESIITEQVIPMLGEPGITRRVIAQRLGVSYRNLAVNLLKYGGNVLCPEPTPGLVPMEEALTPEQCAQMQRFMGKLTEFADQHKGRRVNVSRFMVEYRKRVEL